MERLTPPYEKPGSLKSLSLETSYLSSCKAQVRFSYPLSSVELANLIQTPGGGIMASGTVSALSTGEHIIIGGLVVQLLFFCCFVVTSAVFHVRISRAPTTKILAHSIPWERQLYVLYGASLLILVRSIFRLIEYAQGNDGYLISHEVFLYIFDSTLMVATMVLLALAHPSEITGLLGSGKAMRHVITLQQLA